MDNSFDLFIKDLLTKKELRVLQKRFQIVQFLKTDLAYREITRKMGISTTTVVRLNKRLKIRSGIKKKRTYRKTTVSPNVCSKKGLSRLPWKIG